MTYEYITAQRTSRHTSGHESEELDEFLNRYAIEGWRLHSVVVQTEFHQLFVFEREKK